MAFDPYHKWLGIPPAEQPANHYRLLAINLFEDDPDVIENAADRQMAHVRTFHSGPHSAESQKLLNELSAAKLDLLDPQKRVAYDAELCRTTLVSPPVVPPPPASPVFQSLFPPPAVEPPQPSPIGVVGVLATPLEAPTEFVIDRNHAPRAGEKARPRRGNSGWAAAGVVTLAAVVLVGSLIWWKHSQDPAPTTTPQVNHA